MFVPGDEEEGATGVEVYRAAEPPSFVMDFLIILKAKTNGLFEMPNAQTLAEFWKYYGHHEAF